MRPATSSTRSQRPRSSPRGARADASRECAPLDGRRASLHAVALEDLLTGGAQLGAILLQARLHGVVVTQLLAAQAGCIARTGLLLLRSAGMTGLCEA